MRIPTIACSVFLFAMTGCDLSEAERMDITRQKVESVAPDVRGVTFNGRKQISMDTLLALAPGWPSVWSVAVGDSGTAFSDDSYEFWTIRGSWNGTTIFVEQGNSTYWDTPWETIPVAGAWMRHPSQLRLELWLLDGRTWTYTNIFLQDFNELHWDSTFARISPKSGDTLRLKVGVDRGSPGRSDSMPVFADYKGLRTLGNYVTYLRPNDTATLSWVVTAVAGDTVSLDLGWGTLGESQSFGFRVKR